ncbi:MAG: hypothetical protein IIB36_01310 [Gemmatimonadetes bacterium]|nr:hypothetical protein [Gemmatimonadota bacterium]
MDESQSTDAPEEAGQTEPTDEAVVAAEAEQSEIPSLPSRLFNVFLSPGKVMEAVAKDPVWVGALLVGAVLVALQAALIPFDMIMETQRQAALEAGRDMPEIPEWLMNIMRYGTPVFAMIGTFLRTVVFAGLYWLIFSFVLGDEGRYRQYLAVGAHALFVPALIGLALVPLKIMTGDAQATLNLGSFLFFLPDGYWSNVFRLMDLTGIWSALIIAQGAHSIDAKRSFGSAAAILIAIVFIVALIFGIFT